MNLNKTMLIGNLTADPKAIDLNDGLKAAKFSVATNMVWKDKNGQKKEKAEFHNIVAWRKLAEICLQYLKKGAKVYIDGRLQTRDYEDKEGAKRYFTEVVADNLIMLSSKKSADEKLNQMLEQEQVEEKEIEF